MVVGLFVGMALIVVILFTVTYAEIVRIWKDTDAMRRNIRRLNKALDRLEQEVDEVEAVWKSNS